MTWTEEQEELLKDMWRDGYTASEIAKRIGHGVSRNAVIGKVHRYKLTRRTYSVEGTNPHIDSQGHVRWTDELDDLMRAMAATGAGPSGVQAEIERRTGARTSAQAVSSRAVRLGVKFRNPPKPKPTPRPRPVVQSKPMAQAVVVVAPEPVHVADILPFERPERVTIMELRHDMCAWPVGDPKAPDFHYCGQKKSNHALSYCETHHRISRVPAASGRRA